MFDIRFWLSTRETNRETTEKRELAGYSNACYYFKLANAFHEQPRYWKQLNEIGHGREKCNIKTFHLRFFRFKSMLFWWNAWTSTFCLAFVTLKWQLYLENSVSSRIALRRLSIAEEHLKQIQYQDANCKKNIKRFLRQKLPEGSRRAAGGNRIRN